MPLIANTTEIKKYLVADATFDPNNLIPYIKPAESEILRMLGILQYNELLDYYESASTGIDELDNLLPYVQRPLVYFAFLKGLDVFNVSIGNNGIAVVSNSNLAPASKDRIESLRKTIADNAWDAIEDLLIFLEGSIDDYPLWETSDAYANQYEYLIPSARIFDEHYKINRSRQRFMDLRPLMGDAELFTIAPQVSVDFLIELKSQIAADSVSANNAKVLPLLSKSLAYLVIGESENKPYHAKGLQYLMMAKRIMDTTPTDYPTYAASAEYNADTTSYEKYTNDEENNLAIFG